jgi:hypothetical protein
MGPGVRRDDAECVDASAHDEQKSPYASPSVSNIAALMASGAVLPAQTTN